jgi:hypothetical protein
MAKPELRKITVTVSEDDLRSAQIYTGKGITASVRIALKTLASKQAQKNLLALRGKVQFSSSLDDLRYDRE